MKSLNKIAFGLTFVNTFNMLVNVDQLARGASAGRSDPINFIFVIFLIALLGVIYYHTTSKAEK